MGVSRSLKRGWVWHTTPECSRRQGRDNSLVGHTPLCMSALFTPIPITFFSKVPTPPTSRPPIPLPSSVRQQAYFTVHQTTIYAHTHTHTHTPTPPHRNIPQVLSLALPPTIFTTLPVGSRTVQSAMTAQTAKSRGKMQTGRHQRRWCACAPKKMAGEGGGTGFFFLSLFSFFLRGSGGGEGEGVNGGNFKNEKQGEAFHQRQERDGMRGRGKKHVVTWTKRVLFFYRISSSFFPFVSLAGREGETPSFRLLFFCSSIYRCVMGVSSLWTLERCPSLSFSYKLCIREGNFVVFFSLSMSSTSIFLLLFLWCAIYLFLLSFFLFFSNYWCSFWGEA